MNDELEQPWWLTYFRVGHVYRLVGGDPSAYVMFGDARQTVYKVMPRGVTFADERGPVRFISPSGFEMWRPVFEEVKQRVTR